MRIDKKDYYSARSSAWFRAYLEMNIRGLNGGQHTWVAGFRDNRNFNLDFTNSDSWVVIGQIENHFISGSSYTPWEPNDGDGV